MRESLDEPERSPARRSPTASSSTTPIRRWSPQLLAALDKEQARVRPAGARPRARRAGGDDPRVQPALLREVDARRGFLPQRGHRGARRLQGARTPFDALTAIAKLDGPLQDDAALALGKIGDKRALETLAGLQRTAPRDDAAVDRRGDLPARRQLRVARELSDRDAEVRGQEHRLPGTAARRRRRPRRARRSPGDDEAADALFDVGIPSQRSDARAGGAGARRRSRCATRR